MAHTLAKQYIMRTRLLHQVTEDLRGMGEQVEVTDDGKMIFPDGSQLVLQGKVLVEVTDKELA